MAQSDTMVFSSLEQEVSHWRELAHKYKEMYESSQLELEDFQSSSKELEKELEAQLDQAENRVRELTTIKSRLQSDLSIYKEKLEKLQASSSRQVSELEMELAKSVAFGERMQKYIRELEQTNDDLERAKRAAVVSLEDFEGRLNLAIERNAFLESELDEKESLVVCVQRLKDEARDLRNELAVHNKSDDETKSDKEEEQMDVDGTDIRTTKATEDASQVLSTNHSIEMNNKQETSFVMEPVTPCNGVSDMTKSRLDATPSVKNTSFVSASPINTSTRISALNIVSDLLRKVGALESKLNSCRGVACNQTPFSQRGRERTLTSSPTNSPSSKRLSMGSGFPMKSSSVNQSGYVQITV